MLDSAEADPLTDAFHTFGAKTAAKHSEGGYGGSFMPGAQLGVARRDTNAAKMPAGATREMRQQLLTKASLLE